MHLCIFIYLKGRLLCCRFSKNNAGAMNMRKEEAIRILCLIEHVYPVIMIKSETVTRWLNLCEHLDYNKVLARLQAHIRKSPYPPGLNDLAILSDPESELPQSFQEWVEAGRIEPEFMIRLQ
jgi:hypothetical protein